MRIAITATGPTLDDALDERFGRARYFLIVDTESEAVEAIDNSINLSAAQGAGIQAAQRVAEQKVEALVTGHCGPKAFRALAAANIAIYTGASGTGRQGLEALKAGKLTAAGGPDVGGHWS